MTQKSGEYVIESLIKKFINISYAKIESFTKSNETSFRREVKQSEDVEFQNLLHGINVCAENSLPSLLKVLLDWHSSSYTHIKSKKLPALTVRTEEYKLPDVCATSEVGVLENSISNSPCIVNDSISSTLETSGDFTSSNLIEKRNLAVDYIFCYSIISVLKQLHLHPGNDDSINNIVIMAFEHFKFQDDLSNPNHNLINEIADLYAEVVGVLTQSRFNIVKTKFNNELKALRSKDTSAINSNNIVSLLMGMKFFRVKMYPIEDFVECFNFLTELANYFLEVVDKKIKHALSGLLVEVLLPVAAVVKNEVNIPVLKSFVELLYNHCFEMSSKKKHFRAISPLATCLLSVSQKEFFLNNWPGFLMICLPDLNKRDNERPRVALESLFRLLWVYIVRIKGEKHNDTQSKLYTIVNSLFPKGSRTVVPRYASTSIFVKIIHFIAQEKLDFAMEVIFDLMAANRSNKPLCAERINIGLCAFLLIAHSLQQREGEPPMPQNSTNHSTSSNSACDETNGRNPNSSVTHNSQTKGTETNLPNSASSNQPLSNFPHSSPYYSQNSRISRLNSMNSNFRHQINQGQQNHSSGQSVNVSNAKRRVSYSFMTLNDRNAASIGISNYITQVRKAFEVILKTLDQQVIRTMLLTKQENFNKESDEVIPAERKPKIDLLKTCISAIPRLLPVDMSKSDLVELLARLSIHVDEELRMMSQQSLVSIIQEFPNWRYKTLQTFLNFVLKEITDNSPAQLESSLRIIYHLITSWKAALMNNSSVNQSSVNANCKENSQKSKALDKTLLDDVEGFCLVMLCQCRSSIRRLSVHILKEVKALINQIHIDIQQNLDKSNDEEIQLKFEPINQSFCIDTIDSAVPEIMIKVFPLLSLQEKTQLQNLTFQTSDFMLLAERTNPIWGVVSNNLACQHTESNILQNDSEATKKKQKHNLWAECISVIFNRQFLMKTSPNAVQKTWHSLLDRINHLFQVIDPNAQIAENRTSSLLKGSSSSKKPLTPAEKEHNMLLWKNYIMAACSITNIANSTSTINTHKVQKSLPEQLNSVSDNSLMKSSTTSHRYTSKDLLKLLIPLIKCELSDLRDCVIEALGHFNPAALKDLMEELNLILRESVEKKQENVRRRRRKDCLRLYVVEILEHLAGNGVFYFSEDQEVYMTTIVEWLEQLKPNLIQLNDAGPSCEKSSSILMETRIHFCRLIENIILHTPKEKRKSLFTDSFKQEIFWMLAPWTESFNKPLQNQHGFCICKSYSKKYEDDFNELCHSSLRTMCFLICCGVVFDSQSIMEEGYVVPWITNIINSGIEKILGLCEETLSLLLSYNNETHSLLDLLIESCYIGTNLVSKVVFLSIVRAFNDSPDYPCDHISVITLAIVFSSNIDVQIRNSALQLLNSLYMRFLAFSNDSNSLVTISRPSGKNQESSVDKHFMTNQIFYLTQEEISHHLSESFPDLTLSIFSEITQRIETANSHLQISLIQCLKPWIFNIELIDYLYSVPVANSNSGSGGVGSTNTSTNFTPVNTSNHRHKQRSFSPPPPTIRNQGLPGNGWGSRQATDLVLNNLFYLTITFGKELNTEIESLWSCLIKSRSENVAVIIHYLILVTSIEPNLILPYAKQVVVFLSKEKPKKLIEHLFNSLQTIDGTNCNVEKLSCVPYFRIINSNTSNTASANTNTTINDVCDTNSTTKTTSKLSSGVNDCNYLKENASKKSGELDNITSKTHLSNSLELNSPNKGVLINNCPQLPNARSATETIINGARKSSFETVKFYKQSSSVKQNEFQSAPGTLRIDDHTLASHLDEHLIEEDKYATLRAKDVRKNKPISNDKVRSRSNTVSISKCQQSMSYVVHPLPMPAYGGYSAPLCKYMESVADNLESSVCGVGNNNTTGVMWSQNYKSVLVLMLFTDLIPLKATKSYWERDIELLLHCIVLGLDHKETLVHEQCKLLMVKILEIECEGYQEVWHLMSLLMIGSTVSSNRMVPKESGMQLFDYKNSWWKLLTKYWCDDNPTDTMNDNDKFQEIPTAAPITNTIMTHNMHNQINPLHRTMSSYSVTSTDTLIPQSKQGMIACSAANSPLVQEHKRLEFQENKETEIPIKSYVKSVVDLLCMSRDKPLWNYEDVTTNRYMLMETRFSGGELIASTGFLQNLVIWLCHLIDTDGTVRIRWARLALNTGVNCTHRHYASRSLQIFRALGVVFDGAKLSTLLSRLLDTIGDLNEEVQCYVIELLLTLECAIDSITPSVFVINRKESYVQRMKKKFNAMNSNVCESFGADDSSDVDKNEGDEEENELFRSTPNLKNSLLSPKGQSNTYIRSNGVGPNTVHNNKRKTNIKAPVIGRLNFVKKSNTDPAIVSQGYSVINSAVPTEECTDLICELFWLANILLESELDHEYYGGLRFLEKLRRECLEDTRRNCTDDLRLKLEKLIPKLTSAWSPPIFPGTVHLVIKGCMNKNLWFTASSLLSELIPSTAAVSTLNNVLDPSPRRLGFPYSVLTLLATIFAASSTDEVFSCSNNSTGSTEAARRAAANIARATSLLSAPEKLGNLTAVMNLYADGSFTKDRGQWTKCVVKYLYDAFSDSADELLAFLIRLLEESPSQAQSVILQAILHLVQCVSLTEPGICSQLISLTDILTRTFIGTSQWRDACPILRLMVAKSSSLVAAPTNISNRYSFYHFQTGSRINGPNGINTTDNHSFTSSTTNALMMPLVPLPEAEPPRLELPGRVLEYQFDIRTLQSTKPVDLLNDDSASSGRKNSSNPKTKELLLQLINIFGTYGGRLGFPKSPSVIFSQSTETLEHQMSLHSSSETASTNDVSLAGDLRLDETSSTEQAQIIRDLDEYLDSQLKMNFLDLPDDKWEDDKKPTWGVRSHSITNQYHQQPDMDTSVVGMFAGNDESMQESSLYVEGSQNIQQSPNLQMSSSNANLQQSILPPRPPHPPTQQQSIYRVNKSPMSKALGGPETLVVSPQEESSVSSIKLTTSPVTLLKEGNDKKSYHQPPPRPQSLFTPPCSSMPNKKKIYQQNRSPSPGNQSDASPVTYRSQPMRSSFSNKQSGFKSDENSAVNEKKNMSHLSISPSGAAITPSSEEEEMNIEMWSRKEKSSALAHAQWSSNSSPSSGAEFEEEDIDDEDDLICRTELNRIDEKVIWSSQRNQVITNSMERCNSNNYEKEVEILWCDTLSKVLGRSDELGKYIGTPSSINSSNSISGASGGINNLWTKFPILFEDCCSKCRACINEGNYYVSVVDHLRDVGSRFVDIMKRICENLRCPLFYLGENILTKFPKLIENHKLTLMQLQETYDKFCNHVDYSFEILDLLKRSKRVSINKECVRPDEKRVNLCRQLHKMMTQLLLLYQAHYRFLKELYGSIYSAGELKGLVYNASDLLTSMATELINRFNTDASGRKSVNSPSQQKRKNILPTKNFADNFYNTEAQLYSALCAREYDQVMQIWFENKVSLIMCNRALELDQPLYYMLQMFCQRYAVENPDLLVMVSMNEVSAAATVVSDCVNLMSSGRSNSVIMDDANKLAVELLEISSTISIVERTLHMDPVVGNNFCSSGSNSNSRIRQDSSSTSPHRLVTATNSLSTPLKSKFSLIQTKNNSIDLTTDTDVMGTTTATSNSNRHSINTQAGTSDSSVM